MEMNPVHIIEKFPQAFAYHRMITDGGGNPVDYEFLEVNRAFERITGLRKKEVVNRRISEILSGVTKSEFDWVQVYGEVALKGGSKTLREYSEPLNGWYEVTVFSDRKGYFSTFFREITQEVLEKKALEEIVSLSETCLHRDDEPLDYQKVVASLRKISRGNRVELRLREPGGKAEEPVAATPKELVQWKPADREVTHRFPIEKGERVYGAFTIAIEAAKELKNQEYLRILKGILGQYFDRREKQRMLHRENREMHLLFDHMEVPVYAVDVDSYEIVYLNREAKKDFGDITGEVCWKAIHGKYGPSCENCPIPQFKAGEGQDIRRRKEYYHPKKKRWFKRTDRVMDWPDGRKVKLTVSMDVSDRKEAQRQEKYLRTIMENAHDSIIVTDEAFRISYVNSKTESLFGFQARELIGETVTKIYPGEEAKRVKERIFPRLESGERFIGELITRRKDGSRFYCEISVSPILDDQQEAKGFIGIQRDITERKEMYQSLKESKQRYEELAKHSRTIAWEVDEKGLYTYINPVVEDVFGYSPEELVGRMYFYDLFMDEEREILKKQLLAYYGRKTPFNDFVNATRGKNGERLIVSTSALPIFSEDGKFQGYRGVDVDITERVLMEEQRDLEQEKFKTTLLSVGDGIIATDAKGKITVLNEVAEHLTEWTRGEAQGKPFDQVFQLIHEHTDKRCDSPAKHVLATGETVELAEDTALVTKTGKIIPIEDSAAPIRGKKGEITGAVIVFRDYREKRRNERRLYYLSYHDHLTDLYNRRYMDDVIERLNQEKSPSVAIIAVDVNGLKLTNDAYGHDMGDRLLKTVAGILRKAANSKGIIARISGDEFVVLMEEATEQEARDLVEEIMDRSKRVNLGPVIFSLAIGYALRTEEDKDLREVLKRAENRMFKNKVKHGKVMRSKTIETVLRSINVKYDKEQIHTERVSVYAEALARALDLSSEEVQSLKAIGVLHDIGKITVSPEILNKKEPLTDEEWNQVKHHPVTGYNILKGVEEYAEFADAVLHHHERWDGRGYPAGLKGEEIPFFARMITVVDAYEAMTAQRSYQRPKSPREAAAEILRCAGTQFDPELARIFVTKVINNEE